MQLAHIHSLRAIAIIIIVFNHAMFFQFNWEERGLLYNVLDDIFSNGTVLFVFVAGYLYQYLLNRFSYKKYYKNKFTNVILPYLIVSIPAIVYAFMFGDPAQSYPHIEPYPAWVQVSWFYAVGGAHINYPLWFIPMIVLFFLLAPVFNFITRYPKLYWLIIPLFILTDLIHREPFPLINPVRQFIYFLPVYLLGMWACQYKEHVNVIINKYFYLLAVLLLTIIVIELGVLNTHGIYETKIPFTFPMGFVDWLLIQKVLLCFFVIGLFLRYPALNNPLLNYFANISFAIFFLHAYFFFAINVLFNYQVFEASLTLWFLRGLACLALCALSTWIAKKILGKKSRYFIGY